MGRSIAELYIEKRIEKAATSLSDEYAAICVAQGDVPSESVRIYARRGATEHTASNLKLVNNIPTQKKGKLLALAYAHDALKGKRVMLLYSPNEQVIMEKKAQKSKSIAQGLWRAVGRLRRLQNS